MFFALSVVVWFGEVIRLIQMILLMIPPDVPFVIPGGFVVRTFAFACATVVLCLGEVIRLVELMALMVSPQKPIFTPRGLDISTKPLYMLLAYVVPFYITVSNV